MNSYKQVYEVKRESIKQGFISVIQFTADRYGKFSCTANNSIGESTQDKWIRVVGMLSLNV